MKNKNEIVPSKSDSIPDVLPTNRQGRFEEGRDRLGRPYVKIQYDDGEYKKVEELIDGTKKMTLKQKP